MRKYQSVNGSPRSPMTESGETKNMNSVATAVRKLSITNKDSESGRTRKNSGGGNGGLSAPPTPKAEDLEGSPRFRKPILKRGGSFQQLLNFLPEIVAPEPSLDLHGTDKGDYTPTSAPRGLAQWEAAQYKVSFFEKIHFLWQRKDEGSKAGTLAIHFAHYAFACRVFGSG